MRNYLDTYIKEIDKKLEGVITETDKKEHLIKISFFQHERLIHLLVTLFYAIFVLASIYIGLKMPLFTIVTVILLIFLLFYVRHYFFLENGVQYLYKQYDEMQKKHPEYSNWQREYLCAKLSLVFKKELI